MQCLQHTESTVFHLGVNKNIESVAYIMQTAPVTQQLLLSIKYKQRWQTKDKTKQTIKQANKQKEAI